MQLQQQVTCSQSQTACRKAVQLQQLRLQVQQQQQR
jgi:hypothetical protein